MSKSCKGKSTCDYIIDFDDVLTRLNLLPDNLSKGWFLSNIGTSIKMCHILKGSKD